jgi:hypothetical protein
MVGSAASAPKDRTGGSKFAPMYSLVLPAALQLSVSGDAVCRQLFHTLLFQIVRWFAGNSNVQEAESSALLDCLVVGLCNPSDTRLRNQVRCSVVLYGIILYVLSVTETNSDLDLWEHLMCQGQGVSVAASHLLLPTSSQSVSFLSSNLIIVTLLLFYSFILLHFLSPLFLPLSPLSLILILLSVCGQSC